MEVDFDQKCSVRMVAFLRAPHRAERGLVDSQSISLHVQDSVGFWLWGI